MNDQVEYEEVPHEDLQEHHKFFLNKEKDTPPEVGGETAVIAGAGAKAAKEGYNLLGKGKELAQAVLNKAPNAPSGSVSVQGVPTEVMNAGPNAVKAWVESGQYLDESGKPLPYLGGDRYQTEHQLQVAAKESAAKQAARARIDELFKSAPSAAEPASVAGMTPPPAVGNTAPPSTAPLSPTERALQAIRSGSGTLSKTLGPAMPFIKGAGTVGSLWEGGENAMRLWNHFKHNDIGRELLDTAGLISNVATVAPTPFSPESNIIGALASVPIGYYQRKLDKEDTEKKANGGLATLN